ncbi:MAG: DUF1294 domain-containing protein [Methanoregula sp.]
MIPVENLPVLLAIIGALNLVVFGAYARDKYQAKRNAWRTSEAILLTLALIGPFGAYAAMIIFHHKTRKARFYLVPIFLCVQIVLIGQILTSS